MGMEGGSCCPPMDLLRSETMQLVQLIIPMESAHLTASYLGDLGLIQFKDVSTTTLRPLFHRRLCLDSSLRAGRAVYFLLGSVCFGTFRLVGRLRNAADRFIDRRIGR